MGWFIDCPVHLILLSSLFSSHQPLSFSSPLLSLFLSPHSRYAQSVKDGSQYFILLIISDGVITDMAQTKESIVNVRTCQRYYLPTFTVCHQTCKHRKGVLGLQMCLKHVHCKRVSWDCPRYSWLDPTLILLLFMGQGCQTHSTRGQVAVGFCSSRVLVWWIKVTN